MAFLCGECFRKDWRVIPFCRKTYVCNAVFVFLIDDCNLCICHSSKVFFDKLCHRKRRHYFCLYNKVHR